MATINSSKPVWLSAGPAPFRGPASQPGKPPPASGTRNDGWVAAALATISDPAKIPAGGRTAITLRTERVGVAGRLETEITPPILQNRVP